MRHPNTGLQRVTGSANGQSILIVDDERRHAASVADLLSLHHFNCQIETDSRRTVERARDEQIDLIILDLNMPNMSGIEVLGALRESRLDVAVIVLSGEEAVSNVTPILRLGADDFMHKPFEPQQLVNSVTNSLTRRRLIAENEVLAAERRETNRLHEFMVQASPDVIYMLGPDGRFEFINQPLPDGLATTTDPKGQPWQEVLNPELAERIAWRFNERRTGDRATRHYEMDITGADGEPRVIDFSARGLYQPGDGQGERVYSGTYGVVRDVTHARLIDRQLAQSQEKFYSLFMDSPDAIFISELDTGALLEGNDNFRLLAQQLGAEDAAVDSFIWASAVERAHFIEGLRHSPTFFETHIDREISGQPALYNVTARVLQLDGVDCMLASLRDRTEEHRAQSDRRAMESRLQEANKMEALGNLAGGIAHDFNNILASIIGYAELILESRDLLSPDQVEAYLSEVVVASKRARDLIAQMLKFTRGNRKEVSAVAVSSVIDDVSKMLRAAIPSTIRMTPKLDHSLEPVHIDNLEFQQILMNLLVNASDAIEGTGTITIEGRPGQQISACAACGEKLDDEHCVLSVSDTGHGIPQALLPRVFERYMTTREPGQSSGSGMGLWLIQKLVHDNGGHITVRSTVGEGTEFRIHLPYASQRGVLADSARKSGTPASDIDPAALSLAQPAISKNRGQIIVVDDEVSVSSFISEVLRSHGFDAVVFNDPIKAQSYLSSNIANISLMITDQRMPGLNGVELATHALALRESLPIVLITGYSDVDKLEEAKALGIEHVLSKPFHISEMLECVHSLLDRSDIAATNASHNRASG